MNPGSPATTHGASPVLSAGGIVFFTEDIQRTLCTDLLRKAAMASGLDALAMRAIDTGDTDSLDKIQALASLLAEELQGLANIAGQLKANKSA